MIQNENLTLFLPQLWYSHVMFSHGIYVMQAGKQVPLRLRRCTCTIGSEHLVRCEKCWQEIKEECDPASRAFICVLCLN